MHLTMEHFSKNEEKISIVVQNFNTPHTAIDRTLIRKIRKGKEYLNTINQQDLNDIYRILFLTTSEDIFKCH